MPLVESRSLLLQTASEGAIATSSMQCEWMWADCGPIARKLAVVNVSSWNGRVPFTTAIGQLEAQVAAVSNNASRPVFMRVPPKHTSEMQRFENVEGAVKYLKHMDEANVRPLEVSAMLEAVGGYSASAAAAEEGRGSNGQPVTMGSERDLVAQPRGSYEQPQLKISMSSESATSSSALPMPSTLDASASSMSGTNGAPSVEHCTTTVVQESRSLARTKSLQLQELEENRICEWRWGDGWLRSRSSGKLMFEVAIEQMKLEVGPDKLVRLVAVTVEGNRERILTSPQAAIEFLEGEARTLKPLPPPPPPPPREEVVDTSKSEKQVTWAYGDTGSFARVNPLRWTRGGGVSFDTALEQFKKETDKSRRVVMIVPPTSNMGQKVFPTIEAAMAFLQRCKVDRFLTTGSGGELGLPLKVKVSNVTGLPSHDLGDIKVTVQVVGKPDTMVETPVIYATCAPIWTPWKEKINDYVDGEEVELKVWNVKPRPPHCHGTVVVSYSQFGTHDQELPLPGLDGATVNFKIRQMEFAEFRFGLVPTDSHKQTRWERKKQRIIRRMLDVAEPHLRAALDSAVLAIKHSLTNDEHMSARWKHRVRSFVDVLWSDIMVEIEEAWTDSKPDDRSGGTTVNSAQRLHQIYGQRGADVELQWWQLYTKGRAFLLYHFLPYDLSIFGNLNDKVYLVLFVVSMAPILRAILFFMVLVCFMYPGPLDTFQLVQYILLFKGFSWISTGIGLAVCGAAQYYICTQNRTCDASGPGISTGVLIPTVDTISCSILVWVAFLALPFSSKTAGKKEDTEAEVDEFQASARDKKNRRAKDARGISARDTLKGPLLHEEPPQDKTLLFGFEIYTGRGGRLRDLLFWDLKCFRNSCILYCALAVWGREWHPDTFHAATALYWVRCFYGFCAFPFMIFNIPGLQSILTHTNTTGFNKYGVVVPYQMPPCRRAQDDHVPVISNPPGNERDVEVRAGIE